MHPLKSITKSSSDPIPPDRRDPNPTSQQFRNYFLNSAKKSLPLSSTMMNAGKFST